MMDLDPATLDRAIEAAAKSAYNRNHSSRTWDGAGVEERWIWLDNARDSVVATHPIIAASVARATADAIADGADADFARWLEHYTRLAQQEMPYPAGFIRGLERAANRARSFGSRVLAAETEGQQQ